MDEVGRGLGLEQLHREVRGRAVAGRAVVELAGVGLRMADELGDGAHGEVVPDHEHMLQIGEPGDGGEVLRLVARVLQEDVVRGVGLVRRQDEGVPVGLGLRDLPGADRAGAAADVLDDGVSGRGPPSSGTRRRASASTGPPAG